MEIVYIKNALKILLFVLFSRFVSWRTSLTMSRDVTQRPRRTCVRRTGASRNWRSSRRKTTRTRRGSRRSLTNSTARSKPTNDKSRRLWVAALSHSVIVLMTTSTCWLVLWVLIFVKHSWSKVIYISPRKVEKMFRLEITKHGYHY